MKGKMKARMEQIRTEIIQGDWKKIPVATR